VIVPDANLLIYAYNVASPFHQAASTWWETRLSGIEPVGLTYPTVFGFVRVTTGTQAYANPLTLQESKECIAEWMTRAVIRILPPPNNYVDEVFRLLESAGSPGGNLVSDAQIATLAIAHNATLHTADRDFMRFKGLKCHFPLDSVA
jgi:uncharacterized protein